MNPISSTHTNSHQIPRTIYLGEAWNSEFENALDIIYNKSPSNLRTTDNSSRARDCNQHRFDNHARDDPPAGNPPLSPSVNARPLTSHIPLPVSTSTMTTQKQDTTPQLETSASALLNRYSGNLLESWAELNNTLLREFFSNVRTLTTGTPTQHFSRGRSSFFPLARTGTSRYRPPYS